VAARAPSVARLSREALRFAKEARSVAARRRRALGGARAEIDAAAGEVEAAVEAADPDRLSGALQRLDGLWDAHLAPRRRALVLGYARSILVAIAVALVVRAFVVEAFRIPSASMVPTLHVGDHLFVSKLAYGIRIPFTTVRLVPLGTPRRGDVVVFAHPRDRGEDYVKRVVGIPGDVVELRDQVLHVNGVAQPRMPAGDLTYEERSGDARWQDTCRRYRESLAKGALARPASERAADVEASWQAAAAAGVSTHEVLQCRRARFAAREGPFEVVRPGHVFVLGDNRDRSSDSRADGGWQVPLDHLKGRATLVWWSWGEGGAGGPNGTGVRLERLFKPIE
jgi:signal peptidase I